MRKNGESLRSKQVVAWLVLGVFVVGFFVAQVGVWTGPILSTWFVGTQRLRRGFLWMLAFAALFGLPHLWIGIAHAGSPSVYAGWALAAMVIGILPFTFYRMAGAYVPGFVATLALPLAAAVVTGLGLGGPAIGLNALFAHNQAFGALASTLLVYWSAAVLVWAWNQEFRAAQIATGVSVFAVATAALLAVGLAFSPRFTGSLAAPFLWACVSGGIALGLSSLIRARKHRGWHCAIETSRVLQSPASGTPLKLVREGGRETLVGAADERFPIRDGIADLRRAEDMTGLNQKYNRLYESIGGFYDDSQRVACALAGFNRDTYVMSYLGRLEVKEGDSVLETSVGTGLNFKYLPRGTRLCGIDLSPEMLVNCRVNLQRWQRNGDLFLGNAECLPFADASFDVVFHVGGINFFNDRGKAVLEMIRVAKPGTKILIADETEEHVKAAFERAPGTGHYFKNRKEPVKPPIDLVPPDMLETHLEILNVVGKNRFYALTFRKPFQANATPVFEDMLQSAAQ